MEKSSRPWPNWIFCSPIESRRSGEAMEAAFPRRLVSVHGAPHVHFPPVVAMPSMKARWARKKMTITGSATSVDAAIN